MTKSKSGGAKIVFGGLKELRQRLKKLADPEKAAHAQRFFKTAPGEYGHGDQFLGIRVPECRKVARQFSKLAFKELQELLDSPVHEERFIALVILVTRYQQGLTVQKKEIFDFYMANTGAINNWDLVDVSAPHVAGHWLYENSENDLLYRLARSQDLWEKRISIMATFYFIRRGRFQETLEISEILLDDPHDLIHKASGWMLREVANRDRKVTELFLKKHYSRIPRTMLRYAIEKFPESLRQEYLRKALDK